MWIVCGALLSTPEFPVSAFKVKVNHGDGIKEISNQEFRLWAVRCMFLGLFSSGT